MLHFFPVLYPFHSQHATCFAFQSVTLFSAYLYQKDERALPGNIKSIRLFLVPPNNNNDKNSKNKNNFTKKVKALRILESNIVRTIYRPVKEGQRWRIGTTKEIKDTLQGENIVKFRKLFRRGWYGHVERMQNQRKTAITYCNTYNGRNKRNRKTK
jgi:hypothetical protein